MSFVFVFALMLLMLLLLPAPLPRRCRTSAAVPRIEIRSPSGKRTQNVAAAQTQSTRPKNSHTHAHRDATPPAPNRPCKPACRNFSKKAFFKSQFRALKSSSLEFLEIKLTFCYLNAFFSFVHLVCVNNFKCQQFVRNTA